MHKSAKTMGKHDHQGETLTLIAHRHGLHISETDLAPGQFKNFWAD